MTSIYSPDRPLRIGGRGSKLSLKMAEIAVAALKDVHPELGLPGAVKYIVITTSGDMTQQKGDIPLAAFGSKELWTKEIEMALEGDRIDIGLHCVKDVPSFVSPAFAFPTVLKREDPRDCWISRTGQPLSAMPQGATIGTASVRRQGILLAQRSDLNIKPIRGNVDTRLEKLRAGYADAIILARAGLSRLGMNLPEFNTDLSVEDMLPACGQGALCFETLSANTQLMEFLAPVNHAQSEQEILAERALLQTLDGTCSTPISAYAQSDGTTLTLRGLVVRPDGTGMTTGSRTGAVADAEKLGRELGDELKRNSPADIFDKASDHAAGTVHS